MARLAIRRLKYFGDNFTYESPPINDGINIIEGANGTGKSTFSDLLYYSLSGSPEMLNPDKESRHKEILSDKNNYVETLIQIDSSFYTLLRFVKSNDITVSSSDNNIEILPIFRTPGKKVIFSDWILSKLGIEPVELSMGSNSWFLNIKDLMRLIYHNQAPNPKDVYKIPDASGYITDSKVIRKAILEVLLGKSFHNYYRVLSELRLAESERSRLKGAVDLYTQMRSEIATSDQKEINVTFLKEELKQKEDQLRRLELYLNSLNSQVTAPTDSLSRLSILKTELISSEMTIIESQKKRNNLVGDVIKLQQVKKDLIIEVTQIKKMIYTHEKLSLFSADTCPYCLREVQRLKGRCVCGSNIDESQYERFFYSGKEYLEILKSKQKSVETVDIAVSSTESEIKELDKIVAVCEESIKNSRSQMNDILDNVDRSFDAQATKETVEVLSKVTNEINALKQSISLEEKRQDIENKYNEADSSFKSLTKRVEKLHADANLEMDVRINDFNKVYNELMQKSVIDCRRAHIDSSYMPVINDGEYREASADVPKRLMYYLTILHLSLHKEGVTFPKFLLIDTPETSGIDRENLIKSLSMINEVVSDISENSYQIILSTGIDKYPAEFKNNIVQTLTEKNRLLKPRKIINSTPLLTKQRRKDKG